MVFEAGAREVHLLITCPPVRYPDFYGINTPKQSELIAAYMTEEEINEYVGASSLRFLSFDNMIKATGLPVHMFSTSCFTGEYPCSIGQRSKEIFLLKPGETLPKSAHKPTLLANARSV
jgi:amidophosphoribosyltransferase